jgi:glutamine amidotransferase
MLYDVLNESVLIKRKPILGICLGMQLMCRQSEEGNVNGLNWLDAKVTKLKKADSSNLKIPHMGWNNISYENRHPIFSSIGIDDEFFFQHSYAAQTSNNELVVAKTEYLENFCSVLIKDNILGVQFHPEKSFEAGSKIFRNFFTQF